MTIKLPVGGSSLQHPAPGASGPSVVILAAMSDAGPAKRDACPGWPVPPPSAPCHADAGSIWVGRTPLLRHPHLGCTPSVSPAPPDASCPRHDRFLPHCYASRPATLAASPRPAHGEALEPRAGAAYRTAVRPPRSLTRLSPKRFPLPLGMTGPLVYAVSPDPAVIPTQGGIP